MKARTHPYLLDGRKKAFSKSSDGTDPKSPLDEGGRLDHHVVVRHKSFRAHERAESTLSRLVLRIGDVQDGVEGGSIDEDAQWSPYASSR